MKYIIANFIKYGIIFLRNKRGDELIENNLNGLITSLNKTVSEQVATMVFDPAKTREEGQKTIDEAKKNIDELVNQKAGLELQIQDIDKKSKEKLLQQEAEFQKAIKELRKPRIS